MSKSFLIVLAAVLIVAPLVLAHNPAGTPKNYCEPVSEWNVHEYGPSTIEVLNAGDLIVGFHDGNVRGDCSGQTSVDPGVPCAGVDANDPINSFFIGLCDADIDLPVADWDEHNEFAFGGAVILVDSGRSVECFGAAGHHGRYEPMSVYDSVLGSGVTFVVGIDDDPWSIYYDMAISGSPEDVFPTDIECGNGYVDRWVECIGSSSCFIPFGPGSDGAYYVFVEGTQGHVIW